MGSTVDGSDEKSSSDTEISAPLTSQGRHEGRKQLLKNLPALLAGEGSDRDRFLSELADTTGLSKKRKPSVSAGGPKKKTTKDKAAKGNDKAVEPAPEKDEATTRTENIFIAVGNAGPLTADMVSKHWVTRKEAYAVSENRGFVMLCSGFKGPVEGSDDGEELRWEGGLEETWYDLGANLKTSNHNPNDLEVNPTQSTQPDEGDVEFMAKMNAEILVHEAYASASHVHAHILKNLLVLEFCTRWATAYQLQPQMHNEFQNKEIDERGELMETPEHTAGLQAFKLGHKSAVVSRNRYMQLYEKFGAILLFVLPFDGTRMRNSDTTKAYTQVFKKVLKIIAERGEDTNEIQSEANWEVISKILGALEPDIYQRLTQFDVVFQKNNEIVNAKSQKKESQ
ncbi:hypothetical protein C8R46DRAFT_1231091 [Mycena filopes]|nr:hypothetical protein C8R46DRAFT_1231091 [Mycena filopes]